MPDAYEKMRDKFIKEGMSAKEAKAKAARIYNSKHKSKPVGPHSDKKMSKPKRPTLTLKRTGRRGGR